MSSPRNRPRIEVMPHVRPAELGVRTQDVRGLSRRLAECPPLPLHGFAKTRREQPSLVSVGQVGRRTVRAYALSKGTPGRVIWITIADLSHKP